LALNRDLGSFAAGIDAADLPGAVVEKAKACLLHGLVVGAAGVATGFGQMAEEALGSFDGGPALLLGSGRRAPAPAAAFANAALLHARVQEDTHGTAHLGTVVIPAALAAAEEAGADGATLLAGLVAGYEVGGAFSREFTALSTPRGFRASAVYGPIAAAAAAGRVLGLDAERLASALSLASAFAGGTTESFAAGSMEWHFENALASQSGLLAATLAAAGAVGADSAFEGDAGFLRAITGSAVGAERVTAGLGKTWEILNVTFKLYPVCAFNQIPVTAAVRAAEAAGLSPDEIERVTVEMNEYEANYPGMSATGPFGSLGQTLMSTRFCIALALADRRVTVPDLMRFDDSDVLALVERIDVVASADRPPMTAAVKVRTRDGRELAERLDGDAAEVLSWDLDAAAELARGLQPETQLQPEAIEALVDAVRSLDELPDAGAVVEPFATAATAAAAR
jgi:2-methylcitrate dehydratase PrpD